MHSDVNDGVGIGRAIATALANSGADVAILDLGSQDLSETQAACEQHNVKVFPYACDATNEADVRDTFTKIQQELGQIEYVPAQSKSAITYLLQHSRQ